MSCGTYPSQPLAAIDRIVVRFPLTPWENQAIGQTLMIALLRAQRIR
jgi:hypothetical protein